MLRNNINTMSEIMLNGEKEVIPDPITNLPSNSSSTSRDSLDIKTTENDEITLKISENEAEKEEVTSPKPQPTAFTIDFGGGVDKQKLEILAKKSQARHQRVQSMSAGPQRTNPISSANIKPPLSGKLSRKTHGYNSEGYFSSDQEDSVLSGSRNKNSPTLLKKPNNLINLFDDTVNKYKSSKYDASNRSKAKSPIVEKMTDSFPSFTRSRLSKSPIVDGIMSRSDIFPSKNDLNLPLSSSYNRNLTYKSPSFNNLSSSYNDRMTPMNILVDNSPEVLMLSDISSPELDALTPDNALYSPVRSITKNMSNFSRCVASEPREAFINKSSCMIKTDDDYEEDRQSNNSSTGTYTIEADNYTEEQKSRMSIDRNLGSGAFNAAMRRSASKDKDPELVIEDTLYVEPSNRVFMKQGHQKNLDFSNTMPSPVKKGVSKEKNVLEITCCYESPTESNDLASATSKQIKSTRNYLEKIKSRVKTIGEKTFQKPSVRTEATDIGSFTSVTTSGVLSSVNALKIVETPYEFKRKNSLTKSQIDSSEYIHRLTRETSVPVCLPSESRMDVLQNARFESGPMKAIQNRTDRMDSSPMTNAEQAIVNRLSHLSLNRCKGDKQWIQEWAESVKKYNTETLGKKDSDASDRASVISDIGSSRPPASPRHAAPIKGVHSPTRGSYSASATPTKIPSPLGYINSRQAAQDFVQGVTDTESYLLNTQNAITNLQAKLKRNRNDPLTTSLTSATSDRVLVSKLPVSQLSRSNSLNYRLRSRDPNSSPLRNPGNYVITGSDNNAERAKVTMKMAGTSRSFDTGQKKVFYDSNMNSPTSDTGLKSNSSEDKTLLNAVHSPRRTHLRHKSFEGGDSNRYFGITDRMNANSPNGVSLKAVLKSNAEAINIDQTSRCYGDGHQRINRQKTLYETGSPKRKSTVPSALYSPSKTFSSNNIRRSSSFNTVNIENAFENAVHQRFNPLSRRSSGQSERNDITAKNDVDYLTDESENGFSDSEKKDFEKEDSPSSYGRTFALRKARIDSPDLKSRAPSNSPKCPNTPEMPRKFGPGLVRNAMRATVYGKDRVTLNGRLSDPVKSASYRDKTPSRPQNTGKKISDTTRQEIVNRLTKSRSTSRDQPKVQDKGPKKPNQHRSSQSLASKEAELSNWKRRSTYDPRKAAQEGKKKFQERQVAVKGCLQGECMKDDLTSPSHSSPVHRSQSFHCSTVLNQHSQPDYSSEDTDLEMEDQLISTLPPDHAMITSTHSDIVEMRPKYGVGGRERRGNGNFGQNCQRNDVVLARDYVTQFQVNQPQEQTRLTRREHALEKRRTFIMDDHDATSGGDCRNYLNASQTCATLSNADKRKTYVLDSDTNSTTNGSSPRNSSIFSDDRLMKDNVSDTEDASSEGPDPESAPVVMRQHSHAGRRNTSTQIAKRHSGDYSVSSSTTSASIRECSSAGRRPRSDVQPRYLDISKYKPQEAKAGSKNFLRKDPSKTYVGVLPEKNVDKSHGYSRGSAQHYEMEQRKQEMEKWKRRALYDPRKAAAQHKTKTPSKTSGSVLRSQSFHGPVTQSLQLRYLPAQNSALQQYDADACSDNDF